MKWLTLLLFLFVQPALGMATLDTGSDTVAIEELPLPLAPQVFDGVEGQVQEPFAPDAIEKAKFKRQQALLKKKREARRKALAKKRKALLKKKQKMAKTKRKRGPKGKLAVISKKAKSKKKRKDRRPASVKPRRTKK